MRSWKYLRRFWIDFHDRGVKMCGIMVPTCMPNFIKISKKTWRQSAIEPVKQSLYGLLYRVCTGGVGNNSGVSDPIFMIFGSTCGEWPCQSACQISKRYLKKHGGKVRYYLKNFCLHSLYIVHCMVH